jgi:hypothetical protein
MGRRSKTNRPEVTCSQAIQTQTTDPAGKSIRRLVIPHTRDVGEILQPMVNAAWRISQRNPARADAILQALLRLLYQWRSVAILEGRAKKRNASPGR